jgi:transposase
VEFVAQVKVITGVERRRRFSDADKARILAEALEPGESVISTAKRYEISPSLIYGWRKAQRSADGALIARGGAPDFIRIVPEGDPEATQEVPVIRVHLAAEIVVDFPVLLEPARIAAVLRALRA